MTNIKVEIRFSISRNFPGINFVETEFSRNHFRKIEILDKSASLNLNFLEINVVKSEFSRYLFHKILIFGKWFREIGLFGKLTYHLHFFLEFRWENHGTKLQTLQIKLNWEII